MSDDTSGVEERTGQPSEEEQLKSAAENLVQQTTEYLRAELQLTLDDYALLREMNAATAKKYAEMNQVAGHVVKSTELMNHKYESLLPHLEKIDQLEAKVEKLEEMAYAVDSYSKRLETKYKQLERK